MPDTSTVGIFTLNEVTARQNQNAWPNASPLLTLTGNNGINEFTIDTQGQYRNQFLYYNIVPIGALPLAASDFDDNSLRGQLYANATGVIKFTKTAITGANGKVFIFNISTGSLAGPNIFISSNLRINAPAPSTRTLPFTSVEVLVVAGGGGASGGIGGGGGGGGVVYLSSAPITLGANNVIMVGAGGAAASYPNISPNGANSSIFGAIAIGGGGSGCHDTGDGVAGGNGGGAASNNSRLNTGGAAIPNIIGAGNTGIAYGNRGGNMTVGRSGGPTKGAGGGGAGGQGVDTNPNSTGDGGQTGHGAGGVGIQSAILGTNYYWAGGGGGGAHTSGCGGYGGLGGGGGGGGEGSPAHGAGGGSALNAGGPGGNPAGSGGTNTGGGGGSSYWSSTTGGAGGSGIVVIRYPDYYPAATTTTGSPNVIVSAGYRMYAFLQSGSIIF
jgi:hypothetical protein